MEAHKALWNMIVGVITEYTASMNRNAAIEQKDITLKYDDIYMYATTSLNEVIYYLKYRSTHGKMSDLQCNLCLEASRLFKLDKHGNVDYKKSNIGFIAQ